jgi:hypothetical protein
MLVERCRRKVQSSRVPGTRHPCLCFEELEQRLALTVDLSVDASQVVRQVSDQILGVNVGYTDPLVDTPQTQQLAEAAGLTMVRFPGGSGSDTWHFTNAPTYAGEGTAASMAALAVSLNASTIVTLDYGSGSPQEAAALLAYLDGSVGNTTVIGSGEIWNTSTDAWVETDWKTAGYWASLRAATPLAQDDGLNFLRIGRSAAFGAEYFELGNEIYGGWETDYHGQGGDPGAAHDPATYVAFAKKFVDYAASIDPSISIGVDTGSPAIGDYNNWTQLVLQQCVSQAFTPGFLSDHLYVQEPGSESDSGLLLNTVSDPASGNLDDWANRAAAYRSLLVNTLGTAASGVELLATEFNSVSYNPGKQTTSLVNGLFVADSLGSLLETEYEGALVWDLHNYWETNNNDSSGLYGWRQGGDYGLLGGGDTTNLPSTGQNVPYPTYFAEQLISKMVHTGDTVVQASSNNQDLSIYAVKQADGDLSLLVINKDPTNSQTAQLQLTGFQASGAATVWQYGETQDNAQKNSTDGSSALATSTPTISTTANGTAFSYAFSNYSMTVIDLKPATSHFQLSGTTLTVLSNTVNENLQVVFTSATNFTVTLDGASEGYTTSQADKVVFAGADSQATATVTDTFNSLGSVNLAPTAATLKSASYEIDITSTPINSVTGTAADSATLTGTTGSNRFYGNATSSMLINTDAGTSYSETVNGFGTVNATSSSSGDTAYLYDAVGNNRFYGYPTYAIMTNTGAGSAYAYQVNGFPAVFANQQSGADTAYLYGSFGSSFDSHQTNSVLYGGGYYNAVIGFQVVEATMASAGDQAFLYDNSGSNRFERHPAFGAMPTYSVFYGAGFYNMVSGSLEVTATAGTGTTDQAYLNDATNDSRLYAYPAATTLANTDSGSAFNFKVNNFGDVKVTESGTSETAYMYDSAGQDRFYGQPTESSMAGANYWNVADGFGVVIGLSAGASNDYAYFYDAKNNGTFYGYDTNSVMQGSNYYYQAVGFRFVFALSAGGNSAFLSDSGGGATLDAHQTYSVLYGSTFYNVANDYATVDVTGNGKRGSDTAFVNDSPDNDHVNAAGDTAQILYPSNVVNVAAFANVLARSTLGGTDTKSIAAVDYNLAVTGNWI